MVRADERPAPNSPTPNPYSPVRPITPCNTRATSTSANGTHDGCGGTRVPTIMMRSDMTPVNTDARATPFRMAPSESIAVRVRSRGEC